MTSAPLTPESVPTHVRPELYWDHNIHMFPGQFEDPYVGFSEALRQGPDIVWAIKGAHTTRPGWVISRVAHQQEIFMNPEQFPASMNRNVSDLLGVELPLLPFESDPPLHRFYRTLIQGWFQPRAVNALDEKMRRICNDLMSKFEARNGCEFVSEFGHVFPSYIFLELVGMPQERLAEFLEWEDGFIRGETVEKKIDSIRNVYEYLKSYADEKRRNPGEDLISKIVTGKIDGRGISETEAVGMCMTLYVGGLDTVANSLGWHMRHLAKDQDLQQRLRSNPDLIPQAIEELFRAYGVTSTNRTVAEDVEFHGVPMRKGDLVAMPAFLASRDDQEYPDPHIVNIERKQRSLTFGTGIHNCVGIHLARREINIVLSEFLSRFRNVRIAEDKKETLTTTGVWGVKEMRLAWGS